MTKAYSTCDFPQTKRRNHGRQTSRFTVISNAAETEHSYDPFNASRPQHLDEARPGERAKVTIHRTRPSGEETDNFSGSSAPANTGRRRRASQTSVATRSDRTKQQKLLHPRVYASRSSMASSIRSRSSAGYIRAPVGHKRGISFSHNRKPSVSNQKASTGQQKPIDESQSKSAAGPQDTGTVRPIRSSAIPEQHVRSKKTPFVGSQPLPSASNSGRNSLLWTEDVRQLSSSLAKDCDEAFNRPSTNAGTEDKNKMPVSSHDPRNTRHPSPLAASPVAEIPQRKSASLSNRPLPPPPARSDSVKIELLEARRQAELRKSGGGDSPGYLDRMVTHIDRLMQPLSPVEEGFPRRVLSAPPSAEPRYNTASRHLPSIYEAGKEEDSIHKSADVEKLEHRRPDANTSRIASAPEPREVSCKRTGPDNARPDFRTRETIRVVHSSPKGSIEVPAPLTIRKKTSQVIPTYHDSNIPANKTGVAGVELRQQDHDASGAGAFPDLGSTNEDHGGDDSLENESQTGTVVKRKSAWFRRTSRMGEDDSNLSTNSSENTTVHHQLDPPEVLLPKKRGFSLGKLFKKRSSKINMSLGG
jgi:serine/threonine-protein kinase HSL1 (negative regulator of Swe1 kinase)